MALARSALRRFCLWFVLYCACLAIPSAEAAGTLPLGLAKGVERDPGDTGAPVLRRSARIAGRLERLSPVVIRTNISSLVHAGLRGSELVGQVPRLAGLRRDSPSGGAGQPREVSKRKRRGVRDAGEASRPWSAPLVDSPSSSSASRDSQPTRDAEHGESESLSHGDSESLCIRSPPWGGSPGALEREDSGAERAHKFLAEDDDSSASPSTVKRSPIGDGALIQVPLP